MTKDANAPTRWSQRHEDWHRSRDLASEDDDGEAHPGDGTEATDRLHTAGVPGQLVADAADTVADPQLAHRRHYRRAPHPVHDQTWVEGPNYTLSRTPSRVDWGGPMFGQHNAEVLEEILGYDADRIAELIIAGAVA